VLLLLVILLMMMMMVVVVIDDDNDDEVKNDSTVDVDDVHILCRLPGQKVRKGWLELDTDIPEKYAGTFPIHSAS